MQVRFELQPRPRTWLRHSWSGPVWRCKPAPLQELYEPARRAMKRTASSAASFGDFRCARCRNIVSAAHLLSGVNNRNHCPYCLWSCHLDLFSAGDRLSACRGQMKPIGLTMKKGRNKYRLESGGELMLIRSEERRVGKECSARTT